MVYVVAYDLLYMWISIGNKTAHGDNIVLVMYRQYCVMNCVAWGVSTALSQQDVCHYAGKHVCVRPGTWGLLLQHIV